MSIFKLKNVSYLYDNSKSKVLSGITYNFEVGKFYAIVGKSGAGKSTLLSLLAGLDSPSSGEILFNNTNIEKIGFSEHSRKDISLVFQNYNLIDYLTPLENLKLVSKNANKDILLKLGLEEEHVNRNVMKLSGGQQQRVAIARALVSEAPIILADELMKMSVNGIDIVNLVIVMIAIVIISVVVALLPILKMKPKKILTNIN